MRTTVILAALAVLVPGLRAQEAAGRGVSVYRLSFAVHEQENNKRLNTRTYAMLVQAGSRGQINASTRVPVPAEPGSRQFNYHEVGLNLTCKLAENERQLLLDTEISLSNINVEAPQPHVRSMRTQSSTVVPPAKPTTVIEIDDLGSRRRFEFEVTATKVN